MHPDRDATGASAHRPAKTLVTGATGAIGGALVDELQRAGQPFRAMCPGRDLRAFVAAHRDAFR